MNHTTSIIKSDEPDVAHIYHELQATNYSLNLCWPSAYPLKLSRNGPQGSRAIAAHRYALFTGLSSAKIAFTAHFSPEKAKPDAPFTIKERDPESWNNYWSHGGFVDLTSPSNLKAGELQQRIILSQYHIRVNSAAKGQFPKKVDP